MRILRDDDNLYFGIRAFDRDPSGIAATKMGRDGELEGDDHVMVVLDTFGDRRNGFFFAVTPRGARAEGQISNNSESLNFDWDGIWDAAARVDGEGWTAELAIPFKTLRFRKEVDGLGAQRPALRRAPAGDRPLDGGAPRRLDLEPLRGGAPRGALRRAAGPRPRRPALPLGRSDGRGGRGQGRRRRLQERHPEPHRLAHRQHRLRGDGGGRPPGQPDPLPAVLPREAVVLPRGRRHLRGGGARRRQLRPRPLLQPPHRPSPGAGGPDPRGPQGLGARRSLERGLPRRRDGSPGRSRPRSPEPALGPGEPQRPPPVVRGRPS